MNFFHLFGTKLNEFGALLWFHGCLNLWQKSSTDSRKFQNFTHVEEFVKFA